MPETKDLAWPGFKKVGDAMVSIRWIQGWIDHQDAQCEAYLWRIRLWPVK